VVDASGVCFAALIELLMLKRSAPGILRIQDSSVRGGLLRELLNTQDQFRCADGLGLYHASAGSVAGGDHANDFADHARRTLERAGLQSEASLRLSGALFELLGNVDEHAGCNAVCLSGYSVGPGQAWVCVADSGAGVLRGYQDSPLNDKPVDACGALNWAVVQHISRTGERGRGTGFQTVVNALRSLDGALRVRSDEGSIELRQLGSDVSALVREQGKLSGFVVSVHLRWHPS
jgi:hypothetical protein